MAKFVFFALPTANPKQLPILIKPILITFLCAIIRTMNMNNIGKKIYLKTLGCQMNFLDSEVAVGILAGDGFELVDSPGEADIILFNGCSVRQHAEERVWEGLARLKK